MVIAVMSSGFSRRGLFSLFARPLKATGDAAKTVGASLSGQGAAEPEPGPPVPVVAVVQGRHCTALDDYCSLCVERCPEPGALHASQIIPMVVPEVCTGCGICQQVCPAPENAVLLLPRAIREEAPDGDSEPPKD